MRELPKSEYRKLMLTKKEPIDPEGLKRFPKYMRHKIYPFVFKCKGVFFCPYEKFLDRHDFARWVYDQVNEGIVYVFSWRGKVYTKKKEGALRPYRLAILENKIKNEKLTTEFIELTRISKFSWWEPDKKKQKKGDTFDFY